MDDLSILPEAVLAAVGLGQGESHDIDLRPEGKKQVFLSWRGSFLWEDGKGMPELAYIESTGGA